MTAARALCLLYVLGSGLALHASIASSQRSAFGYAIGFAGVDLLLLAAAAREYLTADERRAAAARAERAVRPRAYDSAEGVVRVALAGGCCERWWTSAGTEHDAGCSRTKRTA